MKGKAGKKPNPTPTPPWLSASRTISPTGILMVSVVSDKETGFFFVSKVEYIYFLIFFIIHAVLMKINNSEGIQIRYKLYPALS